MRLAHRFAMENDLITADVIEAIEFPEWVGRHRVTAVPTTLVNGAVTLQGSLPEEAFLEQILRSVDPAAARPAAAPLDRGAQR